MSRSISSAIPVDSSLFFRCSLSLAVSLSISSLHLASSLPIPPLRLFCQLLQSFFCFFFFLIFSRTSLALSFSLSPTFVLFLPLVFDSVKISLSVGSADFSRPRPHFPISLISLTLPLPQFGYSGLTLSPFTFSYFTSTL